MKNKGVIIYVVGVGVGVDWVELVEIVFGLKYVYILILFKDF